MSSDLFLISDLDLNILQEITDTLDSVLDLDILQEITDTHYSIHQESPNPVLESAPINQISEINHPILPSSSPFSFPPIGDFYNYQCFMQRSIPFDGRPTNLDGVKLPIPPPLPLSFPKKKMRRVCSTEDLVEEYPYTAEERRERIQKYREKRKQRNYNRTIKYASRKTVADNRTRVRGRFT